MIISCIGVTLKDVLAGIEVGDVPYVLRVVLT